MAAVIAIGVFAAASARPLARAPLAPLRARAHMILPRDDASWPWEPRLDAELVDLESRSDARTSDAQLAAAATAAALGGGLLLVPPEAAIAQSQAGTVFDPSTFQPVCSVSDGVYRSLQTFIAALIGSQGYTEYAPLVASGLLRVRLELCVVESFINEAIIPFVRERGISWVLPLHETTETFVAGVVFSVAANFILIGSTKLITVLFTYADLFVGLPLRLVGGVAWDSAAKPLQPKPPPEPEPSSVWERVRRLTKRKEEVPEVWSETLARAQESDTRTFAFLLFFGGLRAAGGASKTVRQAAESVDIFVGRYLLASTLAYVSIKLVHYKLFPDFP